MGAIPFKIEIKTDKIDEDIENMFIIILNEYKMLLIIYNQRWYLRPDKIIIIYR